jgi:hypothetical protein
MSMDAKPKQLNEIAIWATEVLQKVQGQLEQCAYDVRYVMDDHSAAMVGGNEKLGYKSQNWAKLYLEKAARPSWIYIYWRRFTGYLRPAPGSPKHRTSVHVASDRPAGCYSDQRLTRWAEDWEAPLVLETEAKLRRLRRRVRSLGKVKALVRELIEDEQA